MCGIIYYKSFTSKPVNRLVLKHYAKQKERGHEGFGFVGISNRKLLICRATEERWMKSYLRRNPLSEILFHHRMPTSTRNTLQTTHPILVSQPIYNHKYYLAHNGMIQNAPELKAKHEQMGINYVTLQLSQFRSIWGGFGKRYEFNDSEALAHEIALFLEGRQEKIEAKGDIAFICLEVDRTNHALKLHFARNNGAPLEMKRNSSFLVIASENVSHQDIPPYRLHTYNYNTQGMTQREVELPEHELLVRFTPDSLDSYWDMLDDIEMRIQECEDRLRRIEYDQLEASVEGDFTMYQRLQREKERYEDQLNYLCQEWYCLDRMYFR